MPEEIFGLPWNGDLVHQVVTAMRSNIRVARAHVKDRGAVRGGGKKPWRQKGTGRARHGSIRSPLWVGGGVAHGPTKEKNYARKTNKKMKVKALYTILSAKARNKQILFLDALSLAAAKTKLAKEVLNKFTDGAAEKSLLGRRRNTAIFALPKRDVNVWRGFRNFNNLLVTEIGNLNLLEVLKYRNLVIVSPEESIKILSARGAARRG